MAQESDDMVFPAEDYLEAIREHAPHATTVKIAEAVGVTRQGADYRLRQLEEEGLVESELIGNTLIWMLDDEGRRRVLK